MAEILFSTLFAHLFRVVGTTAHREALILLQDPPSSLTLNPRLDLYHPESSFDLKATRHGTINAFIRDAVDLHYDFQAFMYTIARSLYEGRTKPAKFVFIAAETEAPNSIHQITAGQSFMSNGAKKFQEVLSVYAACMQTG